MLLIILVHFLVSNCKIFVCICFTVGQGVEGMSKSETEEMIEIEIDGREKQECLEEG